MGAINSVTSEPNAQICNKLRYIDFEH